MRDVENFCVYRKLYVRPGLSCAAFWSNGWGAYEGCMPNHVYRPSKLSRIIASIPETTSSSIPGRAPLN